MAKSVSDKLQPLGKHLVLDPKDINDDLCVQLMLYSMATGKKGLRWGRK
jgi:hypothetical protein